MRSVLFLGTCFLASACAGSAKNTSASSAPKEGKAEAVQASPMAPPPESPAAEAESLRDEAGRAKDRPGPSSVPRDDERPATRAGGASSKPAEMHAPAKKGEVRSSWLTREEIDVLDAYERSIREQSVTPLTDLPCGDRACSLKATICDLSVRLCIISDRHRDDGELGLKCSDARNRCAAAGEAVARCGCPAK